VFRLKLGRSYAWWFPVLLAIFLGGCALCDYLGIRQWGALTLPVFVALLLSCQLRSGVALDSWWRASHPKGTWQYRALIAWETAGLIFFVGLSYMFITGP
jgi:hypothetical protein